MHISLLSNSALGGTADLDTFESIENLTGSIYDDWLDGDDGVNTLKGAGGGDTLVGHLGADTLRGGDGDDVLRGGGGADVLDGESGIDTASYSQSSAGVSVELGTGTGFGGDAHGDTLTDIENLSGSFYDDQLQGDDGDNELSGENGADILKGFGGADKLFGGKDGEDILIGGEGGDFLRGGGDADTFAWTSAADSGVDLADTDVVHDFDPTEGDKIDLLAVDADETVVGDQAFNFIGEYFAAGGFTAAGQVAYITDGMDSILIFNTDSVFVTSGVADYEFGISLHGLDTVEASWLVL